MLDGMIRVFLAEVLFPLTALITAGFLTRRLGTEGYGLLTVAATLVVGIELAITSFFSRTTIKLVSEAHDWQPVGATVLRLQLLVSSAVARLLCFLATPIATLFNEPLVGQYLRLFAFDIPLFSLASAHRDILVGIGGFRQRALIGAGRWITRLLLIVLLVELGLSVTGAILGSIGASLVELMIGRFYVRPSLFVRSLFPARRLCDHAGLLFLSALSLYAFNRF